MNETTANGLAAHIDMIKAQQARGHAKAFAKNLAKGALVTVGFAAVGIVIGAIVASKSPNEEN